ncbi:MULTISPECIES: hypothetical protein [unclassified Streptomyces]|uniref:hypothetical protein n=1 Tax=unclassified Streptomyces TaxID=2593676 RepID=UPI00125DA2C8|nr:MULTISPECIES: hypothetical protein [unclassified Streptomyces]
MTETRHVVLAKPGDLLVFGNIGEVDQESARFLSEYLHERLGIEVVLFTGDIDMARLKRRGKG